MTTQGDLRPSPRQHRRDGHVRRCRTTDERDPRGDGVERVSRFHQEATRNANAETSHVALNGKTGAVTEDSPERQVRMPDGTVGGSRPGNDGTPTIDLNIPGQPNIK